MAASPSRVETGSSSVRPGTVATVVLLTWAAALAGCIDPLEGAGTEVRLEPLDAAAHEPRAGEYAFVWVRGNSTWQHLGGQRGAVAVCDIAWDHDVLPDRRTVRYADRAGIHDGVRHLVAFDVFDQRSSCPVAYDLDPRSGFTRDLDVLGDVSFQVTEDGRVAVAGTDVPVGQKAVLTSSETRDRDGATWRVTTTVEVGNRGGWPQERLEGR